MAAPLFYRGQHRTRVTQAQRQLIDRLADRLQAEIVADPEAEYLLSNQEASRLIRYIKGVLRKKSADRAMAIPRGPQGEEVLFFPGAAAAWATVSHAHTHGPARDLRRNPLPATLSLQP